MMARSMDEKWTVDKLDNSNWNTWKFQMRHLLLAKGLWGHVDGSDELAVNASDAARSEFRKKVFYNHYGSQQSPSVLSDICSEPKEAWDKLREHFECEILANELYLKKKYF